MLALKQCQLLNQRFTQPLLDWFDHHGRKALPWQTPRNAFRVWISEIMLQQTQVKTVIPYFNRFVEHFPDLAALAQASEDDVLALWSGLGYYSRARNLQKTAQLLIKNYCGAFPRDVNTLQTLPGIGPSTAAAITSLAFGQATAILDGNVKRVLSRYFLRSGTFEKTSAKQSLFLLANQCMSATRCADYTQAIMDLGAMICTPKKANCLQCPLQQTCLAHQNNVVEHYPEKRIKKILPIKHEQFLVLQTKDAFIYLEKRPSNGLWGGLWCLPTLNMDNCPTTYLWDTHHCHAQTIQPLLHLKHTFSHFQLHIYALSIAVDKSTHTPAANGCWFRASDLASLGLATPVNTILQHVFMRLSATTASG